jgi:hypothetical protein
MVRVKNARNVDTRQAALVDGAYYAAKAPKGGHNAARRKKRPPLQVWRRGGLHQPKLYGAFWIAYSSQLGFPSHFSVGNWYKRPCLHLNHTLDLPLNIFSSGSNSVSRKASQMV